MRLAEKPFTKSVSITAGSIQTVEFRDSSGVLQPCNHVEVIPTDSAVAGYYFVTPSSTGGNLYLNMSLQASDTTLAGSGAAGYCGTGTSPVVFDLLKPVAAQAIRISNYSASTIRFIINYCNRTVSNPNAELANVLPQGR